MSADVKTVVHVRQVHSNCWNQTRAGSSTIGPVGPVSPVGPVGTIGNSSMRGIDVINSFNDPATPVRTQAAEVDQHPEFQSLVPGISVRGERANLKWLGNGCIEAKFCKKICVGKLSPRSTQCTPLHRSRGI